MPERITATIIFPTFALDVDSIRQALAAEGRFDEQATLPDGTTELRMYEAAWGEFGVPVSLERKWQ